MGILQKIFGSRNQRELRKLQPVVDRINRLEPTFQAKSDDELRAMTPEFKRRLDKGATLDEILPEAFALVREASVRRLGMRHYDVQLIGGGVAANSRLRALAQERCDAAGVRLRVPRPGLCTDNGAMVAALGSDLVAAGVTPSTLDIPADSSMPITTVHV